MRQILVTSILALNLLSPVLAGGVQGCMERLAAFRALELDSLKPKADRKIGWRCKNWTVTDATKREGHCAGDWEQYDDIYPGGNSFNNFMTFIGDQHVDSTDWLKKKPDGSIDMDATAKYCYDKHSALPGNAKKVRNFEAHEVMKVDNDRFESYVEKLSDTVNKIPDEVGDGDKAKAKQIRSEFHATQERVNQIRIGDHGKHLIKDAKKKLKAFTIETRVVGKNPVDNRDMSTIDWAKTANTAKNDLGFSKEETRIAINDYNNKNYAKRNEAEHRSVIRAYIKADAKAKKCL
ncbi:hypothetical protein PWT90_05171 [Aphanocladium album]|nr:hypothetical protein PWT90_05171 [Aphanocladium album]